MSDLHIIENKLIPVYETDKGEKVIDGKELHDFLDVKTHYTTWLKRQIKKYGFEENVDFFSYLKESSGGRPSKEYILTLDMGKELGMVEENKQGREIRKYFIEVEKRVRKVVNTISDISGKQFALESTKLLMPLMDELKLSPESKMTAVKKIYDEAGIPLPVHVQLPDSLMTCTEIAKKIGLYSNSGNPHGQAVGAIISVLDISPNEVCITMGSNEKTQFSHNKYYPSVLEKVRGWLTIKGKPTKIETDRGNYNVNYLGGR